jgi:putative oxidoreductase
MFPDGWPGVGLVLLRAAVATALFVQSIAYLSHQREHRFLIAAAVLVMSAAGSLLLIGFLTRLVALVAAIVSLTCIFSWFPGSNFGPLATLMTAVLCAAIAVAVIFLGPGALSLDARLFGRREIIIPNNPSKE